MSPVDRETIARVLEESGLAARPLEIHAALSSFGVVEGGAEAIVDAVVGVGSTILVPTFTDLMVDPPEHMRPSRNGWDYDDPPAAATGNGKVFDPAGDEVEARMGALARAVLADERRVRGDHPLCSFAAVGPRAHELIERQSPRRVFGPLERLAELDGAVVLIGVGLERATIVHLAEVQAGRAPFRRWANGPDGRAIAVDVGGCSRGFPRLEPALGDIVTRTRVGASEWRICDAAELVAAAAEIIRRDPEATRCDDPTCLRCPDAIAGGPLVEAAR